MTSSDRTAEQANSRAARLEERFDQMNRDLAKHGERIARLDGVLQGFMAAVLNRLRALERDRDIERALERDRDRDAA